MPLTPRFRHLTVRQVQPLFVAAVVAIVGAAFLLAWIYSTLSHPKALSPTLLRAEYLPSLRPEPRERFVFVALGAAAPILSVLVMLYPARTPGERMFPRSRLFADAVPVVIAVLLLFPLFGSDFVATVMGVSEAAAMQCGLSFGAAVLASALWCGWSVRTRTGRRGVGRRTASGIAAWAIFIVAIMLQTLPWRVFGISYVTTTWAGVTDLDAGIYALSQVVGGKTLLADLPSQYGLFPEFLAPVFRTVGLTTFNITLSFAAMQVFSLAALFLTMAKAIKSRQLLIVTGLALITGTFGMWWYLEGIPNPYYQYWPVRFFWPAISVLAFYRFSSSRTLARSQVVSVIGAIALLWNLDTGLFVVIGHGAYLFARLFGRLMARKNGTFGSGRDPWPALKYILALALHVFVIAAIVTVFLGLLSSKAHKPLNLYWLIEYQQVFYALGFAMLPLPLEPHPWMSVLGVYLLGLLSSLAGWRAAPASTRQDVLFYLSTLGLGLFIYYQGRSHIFVLMCVYWPALLVTAMMADRLLRSIRAGILSFSQIGIPVAAVAFIMLSAASFLVRTPELVGDIAHRYAKRNQTRDFVVRDEIAFIKAHSQPGEQCLVLSRRQGIYYAETGLVSPVNGPGLMETILQQDEDRLKRAVLRGHLACIFLGVGPTSQTTIPVSLSDLGTTYAVEAKSPNGTMVYLAPRQ